MKAIEVARPRGWHTWNSFAGCQEYHEQSMREAQKESVNKFLTMVFEDNTQPPTDAEVNQFMKEWDEGKHKLSPEDEKALEKSKAKLFERIRRDAFLNPKPQDVM